MTITVKKELDFWDLMDECWSGAEDTLKTIQKYDKEDALIMLLEENYCDEIPTIREINDILRFEDDWIFEMLGIDLDDDDEDEEDD